MYGFIHKCLEDLVLKAFGKEKWQAILDKAGVQYENGPFLSHSSYGDDITMKMILSTCEVLELPLETALEVFGGHFLVYCQENGYDRILRVLGGNMFDMLSSLDNLHDHLDSQYPGIRAPSFKCSVDEDGNALILHYYSKRQGLEAIVKGLVKAIGKSFFETEVDVSTFTDETDGHVALRITASDATVKEKLFQHEVVLSKDSSSNMLFSNRTFAKLFPFHMILDDELNIIRAGSVFLRVTKDFRTELGRAVNFTDLFDLIRPRLSVSFESFRAQVNQMYLVKSHPGVVTQRLAGTRPPTLRLKGQMVLLNDRTMLFLCSPRFQTTTDMVETNLFFADIPIYDHCRDLLLLTTNRGDERELVQKLEEGSNKLKALESELEDDKRRTDELLHSILPAKVAEKLRLNLPVESETFDTVSALYSDLVGFTALCSSPNVTPIIIIEMLSELYTEFDELTNSIGVYKLETIGDAYIVVAGIPDFVEDHADRAVKMGSEMIKIIAQASSPADGKPLQMRIGIHTGSVMAGVVGKTMPRYCCFGSMTTKANKMESNGRPMRVTVSEITKRCLTKDIYEFSFHKEIEKTDSFLVDIVDETRRGDDGHKRVETKPEVESKNGSGRQKKDRTTTTTGKLPALEPTKPSKNSKSLNNDSDELIRKLSMESNGGTGSRIAERKVNRMTSRRIWIPCCGLVKTQVNPMMASSSQTSLHRSQSYDDSRTSVLRMPRGKRVGKLRNLPPIKDGAANACSDSYAKGIDEILSIVYDSSSSEKVKAARKNKLVAK